MPKRADLPSAEDFFGRKKKDSPTTKTVDPVETAKTARQHNRESVKKVTLYLRRTTDSLIRQTQARLYADHGIEVTKSELVERILKNTLRDIQLVKKFIEKGL